jgi:hypothetical protein
MPFRRLLCFGAAIMASAVAGCMAVALAPTPVTLATGTPGGVYHPVGNAICRMFNLEGEHQAMPCVAVSSDGSVANIRRVDSGDSTFGLSQTDVAYAAFHDAGPFGGGGCGEGWTPTNADAGQVAGGKPAVGRLAIQTYSPNRSRAFLSKVSGSRRCRAASSIRLRAVSLSIFARNSSFRGSSVATCT